MAVEVTVSGNKKLETLKKEFNAKYPYLRLSIYSPAEKTKATKTPLDSSLTIAKARTKVAPGEITITGHKLVKNLENEFDAIFGLYVQVCYTTADGSRYYTSGADDNKTLSAFNKECEAKGCKKDVWQ